MVTKRVAIVGGGPAGSALGTFCSRAGHEVVIFEKDAVARPVVGESLLPFGNRVLGKLGVSMEGFVVKTGAFFSRGGRSVRFDFTDSERPLFVAAHQVERALFDERLRTMARESGAQFRKGDVTRAPEGFDWVVDATGRRRALGRTWTTYDSHPMLRNAAVGRHYRGVVLPPGSSPGDIAIYSIDGAWFWVIPLGNDVTSVGLVTTPARKGLKMDAALGECSELGTLLKGATECGSLSGHRDFTEYAARFCGEGWALVGDAALFVDPVFSSGVLFALEGAERLSRVIDGISSPSDYEAQMREAAALLEPLIVGFYSGDFFDVSFVENHRQDLALRQGIVSLLAGDVFDGAPRMARVVSRRLSDLAFRIRREDAEQS